MFKIVKQNWLIAGADIICKELGVDVQMQWKNMGKLPEFREMCRDMMDDLMIQTDWELSSMLIANYVDNINDPDHLIIIAERMKEALLARKLSEQFYNNLVADLIGTRFGQIA